MQRIQPKAIPTGDLTLRLNYDNESPLGTPTAANFYGSTVTYEANTESHSPRYVNAAYHDEVMKVDMNSPSSSPWLRHVLSGATDLTDQMCRIRFWSDGNTPNALSLLLYDGTTQTTIQVWQKRGYVGWITIEVDDSTIAAACTAAGTTLSAITQAGLKLGISGGHVGVVKVESVTFYKRVASTVGQLMLRQDDGLVANNDFEKLAIANAYNIPMTIALIAPRVLEEDANYISKDQVQAIAGMDAGHVIANHLDSITGGVSWAAASVAEKKADITAGREAMQSLGVDQWAYLNVVPGGTGEAGDEQIDEVLWYTDFGPFDGLASDYYPQTLGRERLRRLGAISGWDGFSLAQMQTDIDDVIAARSLLVVWMHSVSLSDWEQICDYIQGKVEAGELQVVTPRDFYEPIGDAAQTSKRIENMTISGSFTGAQTASSLTISINGDAPSSSSANKMALIPSSGLHRTVPIKVKSWVNNGDGTYTFTPSQDLPSDSLPVAGDTFEMGIPAQLIGDHV